MPRFIYEREKLEGNGLQLINVRGPGFEKTVASEVTIADVCSVCNNGVLSELDSYGCDLYTRYFSQCDQAGKTILFDYDFGRLVRWLGKLAFNAARQRKWSKEAVSALAELVPYIREGGNEPRFLSVYVQVIVPARLTKRQKSQILTEHGIVLDEIEPGFRRFANFGGDGIKVGALIGMNAFQFHLVIWDQALGNGALRSAEKRFLRNNLGAKRLLPSKSKSVLYPSSLNILEVARRNPRMRRNVANGAAWAKNHGMFLSQDSRLK